MCNPTDTKGWPGHLVDDITDATADEEFGQELPERLAIGGATVTTIKAGIDADLATAVGTPEFAIILLGANDIVDPYYSNMVADSWVTWLSEYQYIIDAINTKYPSAKIYLGKSYREGAPEAVRMAVIHGHIDDLIAANPGVCYLGLDSTTILDGNNPALHDGVHPNHAGCVALAAAWTPILGF